MADERLRAVREAFGEPLPDAIGTLTDAELGDLAAALAEAHVEQSVALDAAIDRTLRYLPWPLRELVELEVTAQSGRIDDAARDDSNVS